MQLSGDNYRLIGQALLDAFDVNSFARMLRGFLNPAVRLDTITSEKSDFTTIVYETLDWAQQADRVEELVAGAKKANPTNQRLQALPSSYGESTNIANPNSGQADVTEKQTATSITRQPANKNADIQRLREELERRKLVLFIGGDLPFNITDLPSRADLAKGLCERYRLDSTTSLARAAQQVSRAGHRYEFTAYLREQLETTGKALPEFYRRIAELVATHQIETIIMTAYDDWLEEALRQAGIAPNRLVRSGDVAFIDPRRPTIIRLYGDRNQPETLIVTEDDHYGLARNRDKENLLDEVRNALRRNAALFIGYNLADPDFNLLWREVLDRMGQFPIGATAIWPGLSSEQQRVWSDRHILVLDIEPPALLNQLTGGRSAGAHDQLSSAGLHQEPPSSSVDFAATTSTQAGEMAMHDMAQGTVLSQFEWCRVSAGPFMMGSNENDDEMPVHSRDVAEFSMARYPVTNAQYRLFLDAGGYGEEQWWSEAGWQWVIAHDVKQPEFWTNETWNRDTQPVVGVSWYEAEAFCRWAAHVTAQPVRLPTEAEWEKAARGKDRRDYPWGNQEPDENRCNFSYNVQKTTPVGQYSPLGDSPYGCSDMAGNVWEWTASWYEAYPGAQLNKTGFGEKARVMRGGSWHDDAALQRTTNRGKTHPERRFDLLGFRCAATFTAGEEVTTPAIELQTDPQPVRLEMKLPDPNQRFLERDDRRWLSRTIGSLNRFQDLPGRRNLLVDSDIPDSWIGEISLDRGGTNEIAKTVVYDLEKRGRLPKHPGKHALGSLLETLAIDSLGVDDAVRAVALIVRYHLNTDKSELNRLSELFGCPLQTFEDDQYTSEWQLPPAYLPSDLSPMALKGNLEALYANGQENWLDVGFLMAGAQAARSVCRFEHRKRGEGTGFLIAPDLVLTNYHVIHPPTFTGDVQKRLKQCELRFGAVSTPGGGVSAGTRVVKLHAQAVVRSSGYDQLDYALLRLREPVEDNDRIVKAVLSDEEIYEKQYANIIQHPLGGPMKVSLRYNQVVKLTPQRVYYLSDTLIGSSGSPVFDDEWRVIALHRGAGLRDSAGKVLLEANWGIPIRDILEEIRSDLPGGA